MDHTRNRSFWTSNILTNIVFVVLLLIAITTRVLMFIHLNMKFVDTDQPIMWAAANDYLQGHFYEPRFYGQDYNTMLEGLVAVPLLWLSVPVYYAVPVATHILFLTPFIITALALYRRAHKHSAILVLSLILCLPVEYEIINSIPRGFVTANIFCSLFIYSFLNPNKISFILINTSLAVVAYFVNPSSVIVSSVLLAYLFFKNYRNKYYYASTVTSLLIVTPLMYFILNKFYADHPDVVILPMSIIFAPSELFYNLSHLDNWFIHVSFFAVGKSITLIISLLLALVLIYWQNKHAAYAFVVGLVFVLVSFCFRKNFDGTGWPFYSYSRIYLGIPLMIGLMCGFIKLSIKTVLLFSLVPLAFSAYKLPEIEKQVYNQAKDVNYFVYLVDLDPMITGIEDFKDVCIKENGCTTFLMSSRFWISNIFAFGGPAVDKDFPDCAEIENDRRYWLNAKYCDTIISKFMLQSATYDFDNRVEMYRMHFNAKKINDYGLFLIEHNTLTGRQFRTVVRNVENPQSNSVVKCF